MNKHGEFRNEMVKGLTETQLKELIDRIVEGGPSIKAAAVTALRKYI